MSDQELAELKRRLNGEPENKELRRRLYSLLLRYGQASEQSLSFAAFHGDELAQELAGEKRSKVGVQSSADLKELVKLAVASLSLVECTWLSDDDLKLLKGLPLKTLDLSLCHEITDQGLEHIQSLRLEELRLRSDLCNQEQFHGVSGVYLDTSSYSQITDVGLSYLAKMPLRLLNLEFCHMITTAGIRDLQRSTLEKLFLAGFAKIDRPDLKEFGSVAILYDYEDDEG